MHPDDGPARPAGDQGPLPGQLSEGQRIGAGRYTLTRLLGRGGMGVVWLARDEQLMDQVALKMLPTEIRTDPGALDDLRRETLKSRKLTHPNIIRIHDLCQTADEGAFISMEYVDGPNLVTLRLQQPSRLFTWEFLQPLVRQLCDALDYAHGEKVIHRDLKPGNMMLDSRGRLKLADFGIAATVSDSVSRVSLRHMTSGTPTFMSPQQMEGKIPNATDDIYSLGATLYELLTSRPPFYTGDIAHQVRNVAPQSMPERLADLQLVNEIPSGVAALVMACLAKDPAQRPQTMRALAQQIGFELSAGPSLTGVAAAVLQPSPEVESPAPTDAADFQAQPGRPVLWATILIVLLIGAIAAVAFAVHKSAAHGAGSKLASAPPPPAGEVRQESAIPKLLATESNWVGEISFSPGIYRPLHKILVGELDPNDKKITRPGKITTPPKTQIESGDLTIQYGSWTSDGSLFRETSIASQFKCEFEARNSIFESCNLHKTGAWFGRLHSTRWTFENCVFGEQFIKPWATKDIGVQIRNCTFYNVTFAPIQYRDDAGKEVLDPWLTIRSCRFVQCTIPESLAIATRDCVFEACQFGPPEPRLTIKTPVKATLYSAEKLSPPKTGPYRTIDILDAANVPQPAGATLRHRRTGSRYEFEP